MSHRVLLGIMALTLIAMIVPFVPLMPTAGLDPSWTFAMNEAVASRLVFGKDIVFTFGPYASIYTNFYHPATDTLMMCGSLYLALSYVVPFLFIAKARSISWLFLCLGLFLIFIILSKDALFFLYYLLTFLTVYCVTLPRDNPQCLKLPKYPVIFMMIVFAPLGLLPLIKGSLLPASVVIAVLCAMMFFYQKRILLGMTCLIIPCVSSVIFWMLSGQSLEAMPGYFINMIPIIAGYTEAMAIGWHNSQVILYGIVAIALLYATLRMKSPLCSRLFLFFCYAFMLLMAFKAGFVRHDAHALNAAAFLLTATIFLPIVVEGRFLNYLIISSILVSSLIYCRYVDVLSLKWIERELNVYTRIGLGLYTRLFDTNALQHEFGNSTRTIHHAFPIDAMNGTTDIYPFDQSYLLSSNNTWATRPVFQSYSAYTPALAKMNADHLLGPDAPDNIVFKLETIDNRFPSLDDGMSWPALIINYLPGKRQGNYVYLKKIHHNIPLMKEVYQGEHQFQEKVVLPAGDGLLFAQVEMKQTWLGKITAFLYKPQPLVLNVITNQGAETKYRFISAMGRSYFLISPVVENTDQFVLLCESPPKWRALQAKSIIFSRRGAWANLFWRNEYTLTLSRIANKEGEQ